jgi:Mn2+/Fe2+ NRAMP family transporter
MVGVLAAGLSSVFPILMVAPLLLSDMESGRMEPGTARFRWICLAACLWALVIPALGSNPIAVTIAAQVSNVFVLPLVVLVILWLVNKRGVMGKHRAGAALNVTLVAALFFSVLVACVAVKSLIEHARLTPPYVRGQIADAERFASGGAGRVQR